MECVTRPLQHVSVQVVESPAIRPLPAGQARLLARVVPEPAVVLEGLRVVAEMVVRRRASAGGILPFRFGGQAVDALSQPVQGRQKLLGIAPTDLCHRRFANDPKR